MKFGPRAIAVLGAVLLLLGWVVPSDTASTWLGQFLVMVVACRAWQFLAAQGGLFSFGHAMPIGMGAFAAIWTLRAWTGVHPLAVVCVPAIGAVAGALTAGAMGAVAARARGTAVAMITFGIGELTLVVAQAAPAWFGGEAGLTADRGLGAASAVQLGFVTPRALHTLAVAWVCMALISLARIEASVFGKTLAMVRDNPVRAAASGIDVRRVRVLAFVFSGAAAGLAGALLALQYEIASAEMFAAQRSIALLVATLIGGLGTPWGAVLGAAAHVGFSQALALHTPSWQFWYGTLFLALMLWRPEGVAALFGPRPRSRS